MSEIVFAIPVSQGSCGAEWPASQRPPDRPDLGREAQSCPYLILQLGHAKWHCGRRRDPGYYNLFLLSDLLLDVSRSAVWIQEWGAWNELLDEVSQVKTNMEGPRRNAIFHFHRPIRRIPFAWRFKHGMALTDMKPAASLLLRPMWHQAKMHMTRT